MKVQFTRCDLGSYFMHDEEAIGEKRCWYDGPADDVESGKDYEVKIVYHSLFAMEPWKSCMGWTNVRSKTIDGLIELRDEMIEKYKDKRLADHKRDPRCHDPLSEEEEKDIRSRLTIHPYCTK